MGALSEIHNALETKLASLTGTTPIAWPNHEYSPDANIMFLRANHIPVDPIPVGVADNSSVLRYGILQVDVFAPKGNGPGAALAKVDALSALFAKGTEMLTATDGFKIRVRHVAVEVGTTVDSHYAVPVLIYYSAITNQ